MKPNDLTEKMLKLLPKSASTILSAAFFVATLLVNYGATRTHISDVQAQQEKRLDNIEAQIKNDLATRREVDEVKATVNRIEDKLDQFRQQAIHGAPGPAAGNSPRRASGRGQRRTKASLITDPH